MSPAGGTRVPKVDKSPEPKAKNLSLGCRACGAVDPFARKGVCRACERRRREEAAAEELARRRSAPPPPPEEEPGGPPDDLFGD